MTLSTGIHPHPSIYPIMTAIYDRIYCLVNENKCVNSYNNLILMEVVFGVNNILASKDPSIGYKATKYSTPSERT